MPTEPFHHEAMLFHHEAMLYVDDASYLRGAMSFVEQGLGAREAVLVAVPGPRIDLIRSALGEAAGAVRFEAMEDLGRNPAWIIPAWADFAAAHAGTAIRGIGEPISADRSAEALTECQRHETLLNLAFADQPAFRLLCPYDEVGLPPAVIDEARRSHPWLRSREGTHASLDYAGPASHRHHTDLGPVPPGAQALTVDASSLRHARALVRRHAEGSGLERRSDDFVLAVDEALSNSIRHADGVAQLALWVDGPTVVAEVRDSGRVVDPLAGRVRPHSTSIGGRGLWLMHQLCDLVQIAQLTSGGQAVRLQVAPEADARPSRSRHPPEPRAC